MESVFFAAGAVVLVLVAVGVALNLYHRIVTAFISRDTERTVRAVRDLPPVCQKEIATRILEGIYPVMHEVAGLYGISRQRVVRPHAQHAKRLRHEAIYKGAGDWSDPEWVAAALMESFLLASSDGLNRKQTAEMVMPILDWLGETLGQLELRLLLLALEESKNSVLGDVLTDKGLIR